MIEGRKYQYLKLHQPLFVPGYGNLGDVLPPPNKSFKSFVMTHTNEGVVVEINSTDTVFLFGAQCAGGLFERGPKATTFAVVPKDAEASA